MTDINVISFATEPLQTSKRRLCDLPDRVVNGDPNHVTEIQFESPDGMLVTGTWTSTPGKWHAFTDRDEFCTIVTGHCKLISESGEVQSFKSGDAFIIPNGFRGFWDVIETTTKHFVIRHY